MTQIDKPPTIQSNSIDPKASVLSGYSLSTSAQTIVGAINEILPKATGVGKVDPNSDGTGEIFNNYEGQYANVASGNYSHAEGTKTTATSDASHAEGESAHATGWGSHAEGYVTYASGNFSHAEGSITTAEGECAHAEGGNTAALSPYEHAEGRYNKSYDSKDASVRVIHSVGIGFREKERKNAHEIKFNGDHYVFGLGNFDGTNSAQAQTLQEVINSKQAITDAVGKIDSTSDGTGEVFNCSRGKINAASGDLSHAEGAHTTAKGNCSHAEGYYTTASGNYSHVEGSSSLAKGEYSHAEGRSTNTLNSYEHAEGRYNVSNTGDTEDLQTRHSVGIGTSSDSYRKNAHEIMVNGDHYIYGIGGYDGTNATANTSSTLQQIINSMFNITVDLSGYDSVMSNNGDGFKIADLSNQPYINGADIFIKDDDIEGAIKYFVVKKNENMAKAINFTNGNTFEYTQEYGLKSNGDESVKVYARYGKYSTEKESKWWLMKITPAGGGSN